MVELLRSNDLVLLSWVEAVLSARGIDVVIMDAHASAVEGSIGAIPRRVMVLAEDEYTARLALQRARDDQDAPAW